MKNIYKLSFSCSCTPVYPSHPISSHNTINLKQDIQASNITMQFGKNLAIAFAIMAAGATAVAYDRVVLNNTDIDINTLGTSYSVSYANTSLYVGRMTYETYAEPYLVDFSGGTYFTSYHAAPTGGQSLYIYANETKPVGFTVPHSAYVPTGASTTGLDFNGPDGVLAFNGENKFQACQVSAADEATDSYNVYWVGDGYPSDWKCLPLLEIIKESQC